jgi:hypothetical protein
VYLRSYRHSDPSRLSHGRPGRVLFDDDRGLMLWTPGGSIAMRMVDRGGGMPRTLAEQDRARWRMATEVWRPPGTLTLIPPDAAHSVWWIFRFWRRSCCIDPNRHGNEDCPPWSSRFRPRAGFA